VTREPGDLPSAVVTRETRWAGCPGGCRGAAHGDKKARRSQLRGQPRHRQGESPVLTAFPFDPRGRLAREDDEKAVTREPGDLPSAVVTRETRWAGCPGVTRRLAAHSCGDSRGIGRVKAPSSPRSHLIPEGNRGDPRARRPAVSRGHTRNTLGGVSWRVSRRRASRVPGRGGPVTW
jgi:hypothetical protein